MDAKTSTFYIQSSDTGKAKDYKLRLVGYLRDFEDTKGSQSFEIKNNKKVETANTGLIVGVTLGSIAALGIATTLFLAYTKPG